MGRPKSTAADISREIRGWAGILVLGFFAFTALGLAAKSGLGGMISGGNPEPEPSADKPGDGFEPVE